MPEPLTRRGVMKGGAALGIGAVATYAKPTLRSFGVLRAQGSVSWPEIPGPGNADDDVPDYPPDTTLAIFQVVVNGTITLPTGRYPAPVRFSLEVDTSISEYRFVRFRKLGTADMWGVALAPFSEPTAVGVFIPVTGFFSVDVIDINGTVVQQGPELIEIV